MSDFTCMLDDAAFKTNSIKFHGFAADSTKEIIWSCCTSNSKLDWKRMSKIAPSVYT